MIRDERVMALLDYTVKLLPLLLLFGVLGGCATSESSSNGFPNGGPPLDPPGGRPKEPQSLEGEVDSSHIIHSAENRVYIYAGNVTPDDYDGDSGDPIDSTLVTHDFGACTWYYSFADLAAGNYTVAFTNAANRDDPVSNDSLTFYGPASVTVEDNTTATWNFAALNVLRVGPGRQYARPTEVKSDLAEGDVIEIDAGIYDDDITQWNTDNITLRGVGGYAHLRATQLIPFDSTDAGNGKGIWVTRADNITIENIEFSGARVDDLNGAGIRAEGNNLTVCNGFFHDNENGILGEANGTMLVEYSEFTDNGRCGGGAGCAHNIYIGGGNTLVFRHNYSHHARIGHNLKSRAEANYLLYNRITDEADGTASYAVDVPNGGLTYVIGNLLQQGPNTDNSAMLAYGLEGLTSGGTHSLYLVNNTLVNDYGGGSFLAGQANATTLVVVNNIFTGGGTIPSGSGVNNNLQSATPGLANRSGYDYHLTADSTARDAGIDPGAGDGFNLTPMYQYVDPHDTELRPIDGTLDIGAYEFAN